MSFPREIASSGYCYKTTINKTFKGSLNLSVGQSWVFVSCKFRIITTTKIDGALTRGYRQRIQPELLQNMFYCILKGGLSIISSFPLSVLSSFQILGDFFCKLIKHGKRILVFKSQFYSQLWYSEKQIL